MPFALNLIYSAALVIFSPLLFYRWLRAGKYREGWVEKLLGKAPLRIGDHPCLWFHAVSVGEVLLLRPLGQRDGPPPAELGGGDLDVHVDRAGRRPPRLSRPRHVLCTAGL